MSAEIAKLNAMDPRDLRFRHFKDLRCGADRFSKMKLARLVELADPNVIEACALLLPETDEKLVTIAARWAARGLRAELAVRKVYTDGSVANAAVRRLIRSRVGHRRRARPAPVNQVELDV